jgi:catechol-2,3-dioxygenase
MIDSGKIQKYLQDELIPTAFARYCHKLLSSSFYQSKSYMTTSKNTIIANIGGTFIYSRKPEKLAEWYRDMLGIIHKKSPDQTTFYATLPYKDIQTNQKSYIVWSILENKNRPELNGKVFCINYRVYHLEKLVKSLKRKRIEVKGPEEYPEGKFAWIHDPDGNTVELWEDTTL